jgi:hypothetical protein
VVNYGMVVVDPNASVASSRSNRTENPGLQVFLRGVREGDTEGDRRGFLPIIAILVGIGFVVGAAVVGLTIYRRRSNEAGNSAS